MATVYKSKFTRPTTLSQIKPDLLCRFLMKYREFFERRRVSLVDDTLPHLDAISEVLMSPEADTPPELIDGLHAVKELGMPSSSGLLDRLAREFRVSQDGEHTPTEIALELWMIDAKRVLAALDELVLEHTRSLHYFSSLEDQPIGTFSKENLANLARAMDVSLKARGCGQGTRITMHPRKGEIWFLIRRGDRFRREAVSHDGVSSSIAFRPLKVDVVVFFQESGELAVKAPYPWLRDEYRRQFSFHLFGKDNLFGGECKYTLEPLKDLGREALSVPDVPEISSIKLVHIVYAHRNTPGYIQSAKTSDLFEYFEFMRLGISPDWNIKQATFRVRFRDDPRARSVTLKVPNVALYTRESDSTVVDQWLTRRGFNTKGIVNGAEQTEFNLAMG